MATLATRMTSFWSVICKSWVRKRAIKGVDFVEAVPRHHTMGWPTTGNDAPAKPRTASALPRKSWAVRAASWSEGSWGYGPTTLVLIGIGGWNAST